MSGCLMRKKRGNNNIRLETREPRGAKTEKTCLCGWHGRKDRRHREGRGRTARVGVGGSGFGKWDDQASVIKYSNWDLQGGGQCPEKVQARMDQTDERANADSLEARSTARS